METLQPWAVLWSCQGFDFPTANLVQRNTVSSHMSYREVSWSRLNEMSFGHMWTWAFDLCRDHTYFILDFKVKSQVSFNPHNSHHMDQQHCFLIIRFIQRSFFQLFFSFKWLSLCIYANWVLTYFKSQTVLQAWWYFSNITPVNLVFSVSNLRVHHGSRCSLVTSFFLFLSGKYGD